MKKILGVSIAAMLAVTPMLASAEAISGATYTDPAHSNTANHSTTNLPEYQTVGIDTDDQGHIASTAYVKGAYNSAIRAVNTTYDKLNTDKQAQLKTDGTGTPNISTTVKTSIADTNASDTALVTESAVRNAITAAGGQTESQVKALIGNAAAGASDGLTGDTSNGTLAVNVDDSTIEIDATSGKVQIKADGVDTTQLKDDAVVTAKIADDAVTNDKIADDAVNTAQIVNEAVTLGKISSTDKVNSSDSNYSGRTQLTQKGYVDETVANATNGMAKQAGVVNTIGSSYVTLYTDWAHQTYTQNVGITTPSGGYTETVVAPPAGVSQ